MTPMEQAVLRAYEAGEKPIETAKALGVSRQRVNEIRSSLRRRGYIKSEGRSNGHDSADRLEVRLSLSAIAAVEKQAAKRGLTTPAMIRRLVETIAADHMFDAVLDDQA